MSIKKAAGRGRTGQMAAVDEQWTAPPKFPPNSGGRQRWPRVPFNWRLSSTLDQLLELEELGLPIARRFRHELERHVPA